jgi:hypothetical protein
MNNAILEVGVQFAMPDPGIDDRKEEWDLRLPTYLPAKTTPKSGLRGGISLRDFTHSFWRLHPLVEFRGERIFRDV